MCLSELFSCFWEEGYYAKGCTTPAYDLKGCSQIVQNLKKGLLVSMDMGEMQLWKAITGYYFVMVELSVIPLSGKFKW